MSQTFDSSRSDSEVLTAEAGGRRAFIKTAGGGK